MRLHFVCVLAIGLALGADDPKNAKDDGKNIQGTWKLVAVEDSGSKVPEDKIKGLIFVITTDKFITKADGKAQEASYKLDPDKNPKAIDLTPLDGPTKGKPQPGIYELEGDTLRICATNRKGADRPKDFTTKADNERYLMVLKREKK